MSLKSVRYVQSCITTVSFPETLEGVLNMVKGNKNKAPWSTDLDILLNFSNEDTIYWTAPKWLTEGDVIFFYHAKRSRSRTRRLLIEAQKSFPKKRSLIKLLSRAKDTADLYAGRIFACASVSGATELFEKHSKHFVSRLFAPLGEICLFENPLSQEMFADYVKIGLSTITPIYKKEFDGLKKLLKRNNELPAFLKNAALGDLVFKNVKAENWRSISCNRNTKFINEGQLRSYLANFFLDELKDEGTRILEECECFRGNQNTGRSDYFIKVCGNWIPVEVKLDVLKEKNLLIQTAKYMNINAFMPCKGSKRNQVLRVSVVPICLILDEAGLYLVSADSKTLNSRSGKLRWKREDFTKEAIANMREEIKTEFLRLSGESNK